MLNSLILSGTMLVFLVMVLVINVSGRLTELPNGGMIDVEDEYAEVRFSTNALVRRRKRMLKNRDILWPKAAVIYRVEDAVWESVDHDYLKVFEAMEDIMRETCVRFKEWSGEPDFVFVEYNLGKRSSYSAVGRRGGKSWLQIGSENFVKEVILHELGHTLGLRHEHQRPDRDHHVDVLWQNIEMDKRPQFEKLDKNSLNLFGEPFDFDSIMMYHDCSSSDPDRPVKLQSKTGRNLKLKAGVRNLNTKLSAGDVKRIQDLYRCDGAVQKPSFPVDIVCSFDTHNCNFKELRSRKNQNTWEWKPLIPFLEPSEGTLIWSIASNKKKTIKESVWSVGFYGKSPLVNNLDLEGCVRLKYMFQTHGRGVHTLKLIQMKLLSPLYPRNGKSSFEIFSTKSPRKTSDKKPPQWTQVSIPVDVRDPFSLEFVSSLENGVGKHLVSVDDLEVRYTPCANFRQQDSISRQDSKKVGEQRGCGWLQKLFSNKFGRSSRSSSSLSVASTSKPSRGS